MSDKLRVGVVGFGKMGMLHGALSNLHENIELVAICEQSMFMRSGIKSLMKSFACYADYKKMIDKEKLDAVIITTPTFSHMEIANYAAEKGIALFIEKPLAMDYSDTLELMKKVESTKLPSLVGFSFRYFPTISKTKELLDGNEIGKINKIESEMYIGDVFKENEGWRYDPRYSGGGALIDFGIHMIDLLVWFFGSVKSVDAKTKRIYSKYVEDEANAKILFINGLEASFDTSWSKAEYRKASPKLKITGELGQIIMTEQTLDIIKSGEIRKIAYPDMYKGDYVDIAGINYTLEMKAFYNETAGIKCGTDIMHAAYISKIIDAMYLSARESRIVEVI